jgi:Skp family chaperone for outer membrane proteins
MNPIHRLFPLCAALLAVAALPAQGQDPTQEIQEIARRVDEQLREIDRLLLESSKPAGAEARPKELLRKTQEHSQGVEQGIDELIRKLNEMKNQSRSSQDQQQDQQQRSQDQQRNGQQRPQQGRPQNRQDGTNPEFAPQGQRPDGQQQQQQQQQQGEPQQPQGGQPLGPEANPDGGQNRPPSRPIESETGPGQPGQGEGEWGALQPYVNYLKNRGSMPKVPPKFQKYWDAYLKSKQEKK